jgi:cytochrome c553
MKYSVVRCAVPFIAAFLVACSDNGSDTAATIPLTDKDALIAAGKSKSRVCTGCHGANGISRIPSYPSLAGLPREYLSEQLHAFRSGERKNPTMSSIALNLTDQDIAALSHYFTSLPSPSSSD